MNRSRRPRARPGNSRGQMGIDFLTGMTLFIFTLFFVLQFMFGMIEPYTSTSTEHVSVADRVAERLVTQELADDDASPGVINHTKTLRFFNKSGENISTALGLPRASGFRISLTSDYVSYGPTDGLVGYWSFNERSGRTARDSSGDARLDGTFPDDVDPTADGVTSSSAFRFDDDGGNVTVPPALALNVSKTGAVTVSAWIKPARTGSHAIVNHSNASNDGTQYRLRAPGSNTVEWGAGGPDATSVSVPSSYAVGNYTHLVGTADAANGTACLYVNAEPVCNSNGIAFHQNGSDKATRIGGWSGVQMNGSIDEVRIYDRNLSRSDVEQIYNASAVLSPDRPNVTTNADLVDTTLGAGGPVPEVASISSRRRVAHVPEHGLSDLPDHAVGPVEVRVQVW